MPPHRPLVALRPEVLRQLLLPDQDPHAALELLSREGFVDPAAAHQRLRQLTAGPDGLPIECLPGLLHALSEIVVPDQALLNFERYCHSVPERGPLFKFLQQNPRAIEILVRLFVGSQFLTGIVLRNPRYLERLTQHQRLADLKDVGQLLAEAEELLADCETVDDQLDTLRRFQRWELLRIGFCDFFGLLDLRRVTVQLSLLAECLVRCCLRLVATDSERESNGLTVLAFGKLGGEELNYSSDIDLVFLAAENARTHQRLGQKLIRALSNSTGDGFLYRVDMRLRPWGRSGELVTSSEGYVDYLRQHASPWERQALLKARVIAGNPQAGQAFLQQIQPLLFQSPADEVRNSVHTAKQRIEAELQRQGRTWGELKLGEGSIRDVEFVVQYLQLVHGRTLPGILSPNTLDGLFRLGEQGVMTTPEFRALTDGYIFLRTVEHSLQLMHNKQTHELPNDPAELEFLARRLDFSSDVQFLTHYHRHCETIRGIYEQYLTGTPRSAQSRKPALSQHLARMEPGYSEIFSEPDIEHHATLAERITPQQPIVVDAVPRNDSTWQVTIVGYDYLGELSLICGLLLVYRFNIVDGQVFTYDRSPGSGEEASGNVPPAEKAPGSTGGRRASHPASTAAPSRHQAPPEERPKIVDVFTVKPDGEVGPDLWERYTADLTGLVRQLQENRRDETQGALVKRVAAALRQDRKSPSLLYPIDLEIDNQASEQYTVLRIRTRDTLGFLYELTNALALNGVDIARVRVSSLGNDALDTLYVTDASGGKIVDPVRQQELRAATVLIKHFTHLLPQSPNPESALLHFREFVGQLFLRPDWPAEIASLEETRVLSAFSRLLGVSDFLWNDFLRMQHANLFPVVRDVDALATVKTQSMLKADLAENLRQVTTPAESRRQLNAFKDREMFRVDMRHILGLIPEFGGFSAELGDVAEVVVAAACRLCEAELQQQFGIPQLSDGSPCACSICALGKCGGRELGFASDIELMFLYAGEGKTSGPQVLSTAEYFARLVECVTHAIHARREGVFEIDLRLRPYGSAGRLAVSLASFTSYFGPAGPAWPFERQALVKLRPIAGDPELGATVVSLRDQMIYTGEPFDVPAMRAMRERQFRQLVAPDTFNAKLSPGALVEIEYFVQGLQITHGQRWEALRATNTLSALVALAQQGILTETEAQHLREAYLFQRTLIGALRIVRGNARDLTTPAVESEEFAFLARRLGYENDIARLQSDIQRHTSQVQEITQNWAR